MCLLFLYKNSFGGNPNDITLFGESAGAMSIAVITKQTIVSVMAFIFSKLLATSPAESIKSLFQKVIIMSNPFSIRYKSKSQAEDHGKKFAKGESTGRHFIKVPLFGLALGCHEDDLRCLKSASVASVLFQQTMIFPDLSYPHRLFGDLLLVKFKTPHLYEFVLTLVGARH